MKRLFKNFTIMLMSVLTFSSLLSVQTMAGDIKKVLMVISGNGKDAGKTAPGYEFGEFSSAFLVFKTNGVSVDIASPQGGKVISDPYDPNTSNNALVLADKSIMTKLENSLALPNIDPAKYDGVFVVGGKGAMFDFHDNKNLQNIISNVYTNGGIVSAVCHGPAALVNVKLSDGKYLVAGKRVNGFTNIEEKLFGQKWMPKFSFMLEDELVARGAMFQSSPLMLSHVAKDGRLITGQNPTSTPLVAEEVVKSLGITPIKREIEKDEATFELIAEVLAGNEVAGKQYLSDPLNYNGQLITMYGYFYSKAAQSTTDYQHAIALMKLEPKGFNKKQVKLQVAKSWSKVGKMDKAIEITQTLIKDHPDYKSAMVFLETLKK